jgi:hypothetical protein
MALSLFSSDQNPNSLLNSNSTSNGPYGLLTQSLTGTASTVNVGTIGSPTAVPATPGTIQQMLTPGGGTLASSEVLQLQSQVATTIASSSFGALIDTSNDAYRYPSGATGQVSAVSGDTLSGPRELGEVPDNVASIFLSTQLPAGTNPNATPQGNVLNAYSRFFLQSVQESQAEKVQIVETFTDYYAFFYGKRPPIYNFAGTLLNDPNHKWTNDMMFFYENILRGSQTVALGAQAYISYDGRLVSGFLLNMNIQQDANLYKGATFSFSMLVINHTPTYFSADIATLIANAGAALASQKAQIQAQISQLNSSIAPGKSALTALQVTNGQQAASSVAVPGVAVPPNPVSQLAPVGTY